MVDRAIANAAVAIRSVANLAMNASVALLLASLPAPLTALHAQTPRPPAAAPAADSAALAPTSLRPFTVTVTRDVARSALELPFSASRLTLDATRPAQRRASISELLLGVAGVQVQDRGNPSQDPRLAIRGFGARSAFGVRGVRVMRDGVPLTLPDGQTPVDWLDLESLGGVELVRGTAAALYGNAAGGVVDFKSRAPAPEAVALDARAWGGGGLQRYSALVSGTLPVMVGGANGLVRNAGWLASFSRTSGQGARTWSRLNASSVFVRSMATVAGTRIELQGTHYDTPRAENTGALTANELTRDPTLPDSLNITKQSRKAVRQSQVALLLSRSTGDLDLDVTAFGGTRALDNPLPFAIVGVERRVVGGSLRGGFRTRRLVWPVRLTVGADAQGQGDDRVNFENCADVAATTAPSTRCPTRGAERGAYRLDQRENVVGVGVYARAEVEAPAHVFLSAALRHDRVDFHVVDHFITSTNADDSGNRRLSATSPMLGVVWRARPLLSFYANLATAFETPTITELTNQDNGAAGLNASLNPQLTRTIEAGATSFVGGHLKLELAGFHASVQDELVPFDVPNQPGRRAYRNAGQTTRVGIESSAQLVWGAGAGESGAAYTWSRFRFDRYVVGTTSYAGNAIPGAPAQYVQAWTTLRHAGFFTTVEATASSRVSANDAATIYAPGFATWNWKVGFAPRASRHFALEPVVGLDNVFDRHFTTSVIVNATRSRYFEPGLTRRLYVALRTQAR
jgi:iron complex outermembrane receptor protein